jgi:enamine deaminase RidA (YjgF/YER057c/UK114 family)
MRNIDPAGSHGSSGYSQAIEVSASGRRLIIAGQVGIDSAGNLPAELEGQTRACFRNIFDLLEAADMGPEHLVRHVVYATASDKETLATYRAVRDEMMAGHRMTATFVGVKALAHPKLLIEIEAEAVADL